jgi:hypothetical protein
MGQATSVALGPGNLYGGAWWGGLVHLVSPDGSDHYLRLDGTADVMEVPLHARACAGACTSYLVWAIPLPNDEWIEVYVDDAPDDSDDHWRVDVLRETAPAKPFTAGSATDGGTPPTSPIAGCPGAIAGTPLVTTCARMASCYPTPSTLTECLGYWETVMAPGTRDTFIATPDCASFQETWPTWIGFANLHLPPPCTATCQGTVADDCTQVPGAGIDCASDGFTCSTAPTNGAVAQCVAPACSGGASDYGCNGDVGHACAMTFDCSTEGTHCVAGASTASCAAAGACPLGAQCVGNLMVFSEGDPTAPRATFYVDCTELGYQTCAFPDGGTVPVCSM